MRGIIWDGEQLHIANDLQVRDPGPGEVRVRVHASGICHSDLYVIDNPLDRTPMVLGHEAAGVIDMLGPDVQGLHIGEPVTIGCQTPCGQCPDCYRGNLSACPESWMAAKKPFRWRGQPVYSCANSSSFAEQIVVKASQAYNSEGIPAEEAALIGCAISTGIGAARNLAKVQPGEVVVVMGIGGIGVNALQGCRIGGPSKLVAVDIDERKLAVATQYGATHCVCIKRSDSPAEVAAKISAAVGRVDVVIECSGAPTAIEAAMALPHIGGRAVLIGLPPPNTRVQFNASDFIYGRTFISGLNGGTTAGANFQSLVDDVRQGKIEVASQITQIWPLAEVEEAIAALRGGKVTRAVLNLR